MLTKEVFQQGVHNNLVVFDNEASDIITHRLLSLMKTVARRCKMGKILAFYINESDQDNFDNWYFLIKASVPQPLFIKMTENIQLEEWYQEFNCCFPFGKEKIIVARTEHGYHNTENNILLGAY